MHCREENPKRVVRQASHIHCFCQILLTQTYAENVHLYRIFDFHNLARSNPLVPDRKSLIACVISSSVFITKGPSK